MLLYLTDRKQAVIIGDTVSERKNVLYGDAQVTILGPILFNIYPNLFIVNFNC